MATFTHKRIATQTTGFQDFLDNDAKERYDSLERMGKTLRYANGGIPGKVLVDPKELARLLKKTIPSTDDMIALDGSIATKDGKVFPRNSNKEKFADLRALLDHQFIQETLVLLCFNHPEWFANMFMLDDIWITPNAKQRDNLDNTFYLPESVSQCYRYETQWSFEKIAGLVPDEATTDLSYSVVLTDEQRKRIVSSYHYHKDTHGVKKENEKRVPWLKAILAKYTPEELDAIKQALG